MTPDPAASSRPADRLEHAVRRHVHGSADRAVEQLGDGAEEVADNPWFQRLARAGHVANGVLHLVVGGIAWNLALGTSSQDADQSGAIQLMATHPLGTVLVWLCAAGCALLGLWYLSEALWDRQEPLDGLKDAGKAVVYVAIGVMFTVAAFGGAVDSGDSTSSASATLMSHPVGAVLLVTVGAGIIGVGGFHVVKGARRRFMRDLERSSSQHVSRVIRVTGTVGYVAKGIVLGLVGLLFIVATVQQDPQEATGMDGALRALLDQPFGPIMLAAVGVGLMLFGAYSFMRSRYAA